ncbi:MAG TPA: two-component system response regulator CreB, partial [Gammaproteobacteria bacterium]|nr:two-component system response regulator CreB [Gammaproteobacteria bacterium]
NETLDLTRTEFDLLTAMAREDGKVLAREKLMSGAYAANRIVSDRTIDSHIRRLRKKLRNLGVDPIHTVHGVGFRLSFE